MWSRQEGATPLEFWEQGHVPKLLCYLTLSAKRQPATGPVTRGATVCISLLLSFAQPSRIKRANTCPLFGLSEPKAKTYYCTKAGAVEICAHGSHGTCKVAGGYTSTRGDQVKFIIGETISPLQYYPTIV
jgi:hypothetical protein